jgi:monoamine oxidase
MQSQKSCSIVVIGGGFAGVGAARQLRLTGFPNVVLLEAAPFIGGRAQNSKLSPDQSIADFCPYPIEFGGEFLHGSEENMLLSYIQEKGVRNKPDAKVKQVPFPNYFYLAKEGKLMSSIEAENDKDLQHLIAVFETIENLDAELIPEESLLQYLVRMGVKSRVIDMAYPLYANDYAAETCEVHSPTANHFSNCSNCARISEI